MTTTAATSPIKFVMIGRGKTVHASYSTVAGITGGTFCGAEMRGMGGGLSTAYGATEATCKRCLKAMPQPKTYTRMEKAAAAGMFAKEYPSF